MANVHNFGILPPTFQAHGAPYEGYVQYNEHQTDLVHVISFVKSLTPEYAIPQVHPLMEGAADRFVPEATDSRGTIVTGTTACMMPSEHCSGSHRVLIQGFFRGEAFVMAMEEIEDDGCGYMADSVQIAMASGICLQDPMELLEEVFPAVTGVELFLDNRDRLRDGTPGADNIHFSFTTMETIFEQGCTLSPEASRCFLYRETIGETLRDFALHLDDAIDAFLFKTF